MFHVLVTFWRGKKDQNIVIVVMQLKGKKSHNLVGISMLITSLNSNK